MLARHLEHVHQTVDAYVPRQERLALCHNRQQRCQVVDRVDAILRDDTFDHLGARHVTQFCRTAFFQHALRLCALDITGHDVVISHMLAQDHGQLRTDLSRCTYD